MSNFSVVVVREFAQCVHNSKAARVAGTQKRERKGHGAADDRLAVLQQVVARSQCHLSAHILSHGNQRNAQGSHSL